MINDIKYYTSMEYFIKRFKSVGRQMALKASSPEEFEVWKNDLSTVLRRITGLDKMLNSELNAECTESVIVNGEFVREKIVINTEPDIYMPFYVLKSLDIKKGKRRPAVITPHGHGGSGGKLAVAGIIDIPEIKDTVEKHNYDYAVQYAREGFVVFAPDARGFGERRESMTQGDTPEVRFRGSCIQLNKIGIPLGLTVVGMWTWDLMKLMDYIQTRDDCLPERIGCAGLSGGGLQTLWLSALDDRVKACVISGYMYGFLESLLFMSRNCECNYVPHLWKYADMGDIGALIAPRPLLIETGDADLLNGESGLGNVLPQVDTIRKAYGLFHANDRLFHDIFHGKHRWHGLYALDWMKKWFNEA